jgi:hypothetical protein
VLQEVENEEGQEEEDSFDASGESSGVPSASRPSVNAEAVRNAVCAR